jgi:hypothetical protein
MADEYICREDAVDALDRIFDNVPMELTTEILRLRRELRGLSPADVVPVRHGKWISDVFCSECGWINEVEPGFIGGTKGFNFCPNCGADMRGDEHG